MARIKCVSTQSIATVEPSKTVALTGSTSQYVMLRNTSSSTCPIHFADQFREYPLEPNQVALVVLSGSSKPCIIDIQGPTTIHRTHTGAPGIEGHKVLFALPALTWKMNSAELSQDVVSLQDLLSNKQARGAIGQVQMEDLVRNMLPPGAFEFQFTLSNGKRADCVIKLPNPPGLIAVDSKYPHEAYARMISASDDRERVAAQQSFRTDVLKHIKDIAEKYIIPGETSDSAIMFVPAESVFAELHENFSDIVEAGFARRVYVVSPTTLMATLNTVRAILKDARMREQAHLIQSEIGELTKDVVRLDKRVGELARHFGQAQTDVKEIQTSTEKIMKRGARIENIPLDASGEAVEVPDLIAPEAEQPRRELLQ